MIALGGPTLKLPHCLEVRIGHQGLNDSTGRAYTETVLLVVGVAQSQ